MIKIHPVVWVKSIDTLFYETSCGSGTIAYLIILDITENKDIEIDILQPSNKLIKAGIKLDGHNIEKAYISGHNRVGE